MDQDKGEEVLKMLADDLLELESLTEPLSEETFNCLPSEVGNKTMETGEDVFTDRHDRGNIGSRFLDIEECDTKTFINENKNKNTHYKTRSDMKLFYEWTMSIGENRPVESIPGSELDALWARFYLATPESLLHTVWINNGVYFGLRGRKDHTNLLWGDIELKATTSGRSYLEFNSTR